ncbi:MAG: hypothetical protein IT430_04455 [Phycisphaerales bacterium]|nr:hypothetical protein [Phycisphaerales bacterium]
MFGLSRFIGWMLGDGPLPTLLREGSLIVGWVAMWRPIEIFLDDWWPIVRVRRLYEKLSRLDVRLVGPGPLISAVDGRAGNPAGAAVSIMAAKAMARWENEGGSTNPRGPDGIDDGEERNECRYRVNHRVTQVSGRWAELGTE